MAEIGVLWVEDDIQFPALQNHAWHQENGRPPLLEPAIPKFTAG